MTSLRIGGTASGGVCKQDSRNVAGPRRWREIPSAGYGETRQEGRGAQMLCRHKSLVRDVSYEQEAHVPAEQVEAHLEVRDHNL